MNYLPGIQKAVEKAAKCHVSHLGSQALIETIRGETIWEGTVEIFTLYKPPPKMAYGWALDDNGEPRYIVVLGTPPINMAIDAVRAWIASQAKQ
jgi:hypothetical protein